MTISYLAAFVGGVISILSPCSGILLPAFFAYAFKQKTKLVLATFLFLLGLLTVFVPLGFGIGLISGLFVSHQTLIFQIAGFILVIFGLLTFMGKGLMTFAPPTVSVHGSWLQVYLLGMFSGFTLGSCVGPILGAILTLAAVSTDAASAAGLMIVYALGLVTPLFFLAATFDRFHFEKSPLIQGKLWVVNIFGQTMPIHTTNIIAGSLLTFVGLIFLFFHGSFGFLPIFQGAVLDFFFELQEKVFNL